MAEMWGKLNHILISKQRNEITLAMLEIIDSSLSVQFHQGSEEGHQHLAFLHH